MRALIFLIAVCVVFEKNAQQFLPGISHIIFLHKEIIFTELSLTTLMANGVWHAAPGVCGPGTNRTQPSPLEAI